MGPDANVGMLVIVVGSMDKESMANTFFTVVTQGGLSYYCKNCPSV